MACLGMTRDNELVKSAEARMQFQTRMRTEGENGTTTVTEGGGEGGSSSGSGGGSGGGGGGGKGKKKKKKKGKGKKGRGNGNGNGWVDAYGVINPPLLPSSNSSSNTNTNIVGTSPFGAIDQEIVTTAEGLSERPEAQKAGLSKEELMMLAMYTGQKFPESE